MTLEELDTIDMIRERVVIAIKAMDHGDTEEARIWLWRVQNHLALLRTPANAKNALQAPWEAL